MTEPMDMEAELPATAIDEAILVNEHGELYLFQWLAAQEKAINEPTIVTQDGFRIPQKSLETSLLKIITAPPPYPPPGRPLRNLVAQCLVSLYARGNMKTLFDTIQTLMKIIGEPKFQSTDASRIAAFYCIGELMRVYGAQVMSLMAEITTTSLKVARTSGSIILRYNALVALEKSLRSAKRALTEALTKDVVKQAKVALGDRALAVQRAASKILISMYPPEDCILTATEVESLVSLCTKQLETADHPTRASLANLVGHLLAATQTPRKIALPEPKKGKKVTGAQAEDEDASAMPHGATDESKAMMSSTEMLSQLSFHFNKTQASRRVRVGIFDFYVALFTALGPGYIESNYALIVNHLMAEVVSANRNTSTRYDVLLTRTLLGKLLRDLIGVRMLGEQAQIAAIQELSNTYLKRWPAMMPGQSAPNSVVLVIALKEVAGLLQQLGNAPPPIQDALIGPMITLLSHSKHTVRVCAAWALRCFCYSTPLKLPKVLLTLVESLQHDTAVMISPSAPAEAHLRALGHAYGLTAILAVIPQRPLYVSYEISANALDMAVQLLKRAGEHDVAIARVEIEIAWTIIASLMTLGPNFVRAHLPQLLVLWRNALPKPTTKDGMPGRTAAEWMFLLHVRESALRAVYCFLRHNASTLLTTDVARRIASLLSNALQFVNLLGSSRAEDVDDSSLQTEMYGLNLTAMESLLRSRIYRSFALMGLVGISESTQTSLLQSSMALFASPDGYIGSSLQAAIASSSGSFSTIWQSTDVYAYGVTDLELGGDGGDEPLEGAKDWLNRDAISACVDELCQKPILRSYEHDPLVLCQDIPLASQHNDIECPPPATAAVNAAIELFAQLLPSQDPISMTRVISQLLEIARSSKMDKNPGRKAAVLINSTVAIVLTLRHAASQTRQISDVLSNSQVSLPLAGFLKDVLVDGDFYLRTASSEAIGRLASLADTAFLTSQVKTMVNEVVANRDPLSRAGCALAFGAIYGHVGGIAAGPLLKTTVHVLMSLVNDPHPVVHFWALRALARVIDAASLAYASYVPSTLGLLFRVYMLESHEPEGGTLSHANLSGDLPAYQAVCQTIDAVITVVGPDIQESYKTRTLVLDLVHRYISEEDDAICVEAIKCIQHFLMFAPDHVDVPKLVNRFRGYLSSSRRPLKLASINALYQLVQKDAFAMSRLGGDQLVEELFAMLDDDSSVDGVRSVITTWLHQTVVHNPSAWIDLCQRIMSRTTASQEVMDAASKRIELLDDEGQSFSVESHRASTTSSQARPTARWRTQLFALQCLHDICTIVGRSGRREHLDIAFARSRGLAMSGLLVSRIADLIKIAFTASAAHVIEIRLEGLTVLRDVTEIFAKVPDPDYDDALLLEQYQAPITAALTPAFSADSCPEILASAIKACATFVGSGVVKDINRMGRILKLLTSALEQCKEPGMLRLGGAAELGPNASVMLRIATLSAWAELRVASLEQKYLTKVLKPYQWTLASLWISSLRDCANIKAGAELPDESPAGGLDSSYSGLGKQILLPYYWDAWPTILHAVTTAMESGDPFIQDAMNGREIARTLPAHDEHPSDDTPTTLFYVIFGLVYETLATPGLDSNSSTRRSSIVALQALKHLVHERYSGKAFNDSAIYEELVNLFYRMSLTEPCVVQIYLVEAIASLAKRSLRQSGDSHDVSSPPQVHCLRICAYVLRRAINGSNSGGFHEDSSPVDRIRLINTGFDAFTAVAAVCDSAQSAEYWTLAITLYSELLKDESSAIDTIGPTLQSLKSLLEQPTAATPAAQRVIHGLLSACVTNVDEMRGRQGAVCLKKTKGNLLAAVLILTVMPPSVQVGQAVIEHCCFLIAQKLSEPDEEISLTAAYCAKALTAAAASGSPVLRHCAKLLLPGMIDCVAKIAASDGKARSSEKYSLVVAELWKAFSSLFTTLPDNLRPRALGIMLPTMILLLDTSQPSPSQLHNQTTAQLLSLAAASPNAFKTATAKLDPAVREALEGSVRQALGGHKAPAGDIARPQISLRSF